MDAVETVNYRGFEIEVYQDEDADSPGDMGDDTAFLVHFHRDFFIERQAMPEALLQEWYESGCPKKFEGADCGKYWMFAVAAYIHNGVVLSLAKSFVGDAQEWDTSHVGAVLVKAAEYGAGGVEFGRTRAEALDIAEALVVEWNQYLSGEVYGYQVEGIDSCWGFYGDWQNGDESSLLQEAKGEIDWHIKQMRAEHCKRVKGWIRAGVPLEYRKPFSCGV